MLIIETIHNFIMIKVETKLIINMNNNYNGLNFNYQKAIYIDVILFLAQLSRTNLLLSRRYKIYNKLTSKRVHVFSIFRKGDGLDTLVHPQ